MASGEYHGWPPRLVRGAARQAAIGPFLRERPLPFLAHL
jgi:hypothetical protein